jgi:hypothetical protein
MPKNGKTLYDKNRNINETVTEGKQTGRNEDERNTRVKWKKVQYEISVENFCVST